MAFLRANVVPIVSISIKRSRRRQERQSNGSLCWWWIRKLSAKPNWRRQARCHACQEIGPKFRFGSFSCVSPRPLADWVSRNFRFRQVENWQNANRFMATTTMMACFAFCLLQQWKLVVFYRASMREEMFRMLLFEWHSFCWHTVTHRMRTRGEPKENHSKQHMIQSFRSEICIIRKFIE